MPQPHICVLETVDDDAATALAALLPQVSSRAAPLTRDRIATVLAIPATRVLVARVDERIVGVALLLTCTTFTGRYGIVQEVAVDEAARGHHIGTRLMVRLLELARDDNFDFVELTSRPSREAANGLYQSLGFRLRPTNVYRHDLLHVPRPSGAEAAWRAARPLPDDRAPSGRSHHAVLNPARRDDHATSSSPMCDGS